MEVNRKKVNAKSSSENKPQAVTPGEAASLNKWLSPSADARSPSDEPCNL